MDADEEWIRALKEQASVPRGDGATHNPQARAQELFEAGNFPAADAMAPSQELSVDPAGSLAGAFAGGLGPDLESRFGVADPMAPSQEMGGAFQTVGPAPIDAPLPERRPGSMQELEKLLALEKFGGR